MLLLRCQTTGMNLELQCKQLSLEMALTLGWPLVIKTTLLPQAEVLVVAEAAVEVEVASKPRSQTCQQEVIKEHQGFMNPTVYSPLLHTLVTDVLSLTWICLLVLSSVSTPVLCMYMLVAHDLDTSATSMIHIRLHNFRTWFAKRICELAKPHSHEHNVSLILMRT